MDACPACGAGVESPLACAACGALLSPDAPPSPFAVFGLEPAFSVDRAALKKELLRQTRAMHPDYFGTDDQERALAERNTAALNAAFEVLDDDARRADWLVRSLGGPDEKAERQMPKAFLMEVLEWNEALEEARAAEPGAPARDLGELERDLRAKREATFRDLGARLDPLPAEGDPALAEARRLLNAVRYFDRTLAEIESLRLEEASST